MDENRFGMNSGGDENPNNFNNQPKGNGENDDNGEEIPYEERLSITWYIVSRLFVISTLLLVATVVAISILASITGTSLESESASMVLMLASIAINIFIGYPIVVGWMFKKQFNGFKIKIERDRPEG